MDRTDSGLIEEVAKSNPNWVKEMRRQYLQDEIPRLQKELVEWAIQTGKLILKAKNQGDGIKSEREFIQVFLGSFEGEMRAKIAKLKREVNYLDAPANPNAVTEAQIQKAREYPLWRWIGKSPKDKVLCPFHTDSKPSVYLYEDNGHCFVCNRQINAINWVMNERGLAFLDAVRLLS